MPKRLSDITHLFERTAANLESAEDNLTTVVESARNEVGRASAEHRHVSSELLAYLKAHPDEVIVANDRGYYYDPHCPGSIRCRPIFWAHHVWVEDRPDGLPATYHVPVESAMATAWGDVEPNGEPIE